MTCRDARSLVRHLDVPAAVVPIAAELPRGPVGVVADGVVDEVVNDAPQERGVGLHAAVAWSNHLKPASLLLRDLLPARGRLMQKIRDVDLLRGRYQRTRICASQDQELVGQAPQVLDLLLQRFEDALVLLVAAVAAERDRKSVV